MGFGKRGIAAVATLTLIGICALALYMTSAGPGGAGPGSTANPTPGPTISAQQAIEIVLQGSYVNGDVSARATPGFEEQLGRWAWRVTWSYSAGPTAGAWCEVWVDMYTGEILDRKCVYS
jgi:hypothetical protein